MGKSISPIKGSSDTAEVERERYIDEVYIAFDEVQNLFERLAMVKDRLVGASAVDANERAMRSHDGTVGRLVLKASIIREEVKRMHSLLNELEEYL